MTLIAAFRCEDGVVLCADSQETVAEDYRVTVDKIKPKEAGDFDLVMGGSGCGPLVDGLTDKVTSLLSEYKFVSANKLKEFIQKILQDYHRNEVRLYPAKKSHKLMRFIVCVRCRTNPSVFLWKIDGSTLVEISDKELIGWEEHLYKHEVSRLYRQGLPLAKGVLLGVHLFSLARATSNYIGGPTQVIIVKEQLVHVEDESDIKEIADRLSEVQETSDDLLLSFSDIGLSKREFEEKLTRFREKATELRAKYMKQAALRWARMLVRVPPTADPYLKFPSGGRISLERDQNSGEFYIHATDDPKPKEGHE